MSYPRVSGGTRDLTEYTRAVGDALRRDAGILPPGYKLHPGTDDVAGEADVNNIARNWFDSIGITSWRGQPKSKILQQAILVSNEIDEGKRDIAHGTSTFTGILENIAQGSMLLGWDRVRHSWRDICRTVLVNDFRPSSLYGASEIALAKTGEHGSITYTPASDRSETVTPVSYAGIFSVSDAALIGDEHGALTVDPFRAGVAASARVNQSVFELLSLASSAGPTLSQTSRALFNTTDLTLAASGGALSVTTMSAGKKAMRRQTDSSTLRRVNICPRILLVPPSIEDTARVLVGSTFIPGDPDNLRVVCEAALEDSTAGTTAWMLFADPTVNDTLAVCFVGSDKPSLESKKGWTVDGVQWKVRIDFAPVATDFRGAYRNAGV